MADGTTSGSWSALRRASATPTFSTSGSPGWQTSSDPMGSTSYATCSSVRPFVARHTGNPRIHRSRLGSPIHVVRGLEGVIERIMRMEIVERLRYEQISNLNHP